MITELCVDRAVYAVDDESRTYCFVRRNPEWERLDAAENARHKRALDGYTRIFRDGRRKVFRYRGPT